MTHIRLIYDSHMEGLLGNKKYQSLIPKHEKCTKKTILISYRQFIEIICEFKSRYTLEGMQQRAYHLQFIMRQKVIDFCDFSFLVLRAIFFFLFGIENSYDCYCCRNDDS